MQGKEIAKIVRDLVEPLPDPIYGNRYRAAGYLLDGTYLSCIVFQSRRAQIDLFLRRWNEVKTSSAESRRLAAAFVASGSRLSDYDLKAVEPSPFAWPSAILKNIHGETTMGWTAFVVEMRDGTMYSFGTSFRFEFFDLPDGYSYNDVAKIHSGMVYSPSQGLVRFSLPILRENPPLREKPFFTCYLEDLD